MEVRMMIKELGDLFDVLIRLFSYEFSHRSSSLRMINLESAFDGTLSHRCSEFSFFP